MEPNRGASTGTGGGADADGLSGRQTGLPILVMDSSRGGHAHGPQNVPQQRVPNMPQVRGQNVPQQRGQNIPQQRGQNIPRQRGQNVPQQRVQNIPQQMARTTQGTTGLERQQIIPVHYGSGTHWMLGDANFSYQNQGVRLPPQPSLGNLMPIQEPQGARNPSQSPRTRYAGARPQETRNPQRPSTGFRDSGMLMRNTQFLLARASVTGTQRHQGARNSMAQMAVASAVGVQQQHRFQNPEGNRRQSESMMQSNFANYNYSAGSPGRRPVRPHSSNPSAFAQLRQHSTPEFPGYMVQPLPRPQLSPRLTNLTQQQDYAMPLPLDVFVPGPPTHPPSSEVQLLNRNLIGSRDPLWSTTGSSVVRSQQSVSTQQTQHCNSNVAATTQPKGFYRCQPATTHQQFAALAPKAATPASSSEPAQGMGALAWNEAKSRNPDPVVQEVDIVSSDDEGTAAAGGEQTSLQDPNATVGPYSETETKVESDTTASDDSSDGAFDPAKFFGFNETGSGNQLTLVTYAMAETAESLSLLETPDTGVEPVIDVPEKGLTQTSTASGLVDTASTGTGKGIAEPEVENGHGAFEIEKEKQKELFDEGANVKTRRYGAFEIVKEKEKELFDDGANVETRSQVTLHMKDALQEEGGGNKKGEEVTLNDGGDIEEVSEEMGLESAITAIGQEDEEEMEGIEEGGFSDLSDAQVKEVPPGIHELKEEMTPSIKEFEEVTQYSEPVLRDASGGEEEAEGMYDVEKKGLQEGSSSQNDEENMETQTQSIEDYGGSDEELFETTLYSEKGSQEAGDREIEGEDEIRDLERELQEGDGSLKRVAEEQMHYLEKDKGLQEEANRVSEEEAQEEEEETPSLQPVVSETATAADMRMGTVKIEVDQDSDPELVDSGSEMLDANAVNEEQKFQIGDVKSEMSEENEHTPTVSEPDDDSASIHSAHSMGTYKTDLDLSDTSSTTSLIQANVQELFQQKLKVSNLATEDVAGLSMVQVHLRQRYEVDKMMLKRMQTSQSQLMIIGAPQQTNFVQMNLGSLVDLKDNIKETSFDEFRVSIDSLTPLKYVIYVMDCDSDFDCEKTFEEFRWLSTVIPKGHVDVLMWRCSTLNKLNFPSVFEIGKLVMATGLFVRPLYYDQPRVSRKVMEYCTNRFKNMDVLYPLLDR